MKLEASSIEELFVAADAKGDDLREIDRMIMEIVPDEKRWFVAGASMSMIGYGEMPWSNGDESDAWPVIGLTAQKQYISMYVAAAKDGVTIAEYYRDRLGKTNNGKGCVRFRRLEVVDRDVLREAIADAFEWSADQTA